MASGVMGLTLPNPASVIPRTESRSAGNCKAQSKYPVSVGR